MQCGAFLYDIKPPSKPPFQVPWSVSLIEGRTFKFSLSGQKTSGHNAGIKCKDMQDDSDSYRSRPLPTLHATMLTYTHLSVQKGLIAAKYQCRE